MSVNLTCVALCMVLKVLALFKDWLATVACLEVGLSTELKELAGCLQRLLIITSSDQRLCISVLCLNPASKSLSYIML